MKGFLTKLKNTPNIKKASQPKHLKPALCTLVSLAPPGKDWLHEVKFDGYRIICIKKNKKITLLTRNGNDWTQYFPNITKALSAIKIDEVILDGEIVAYDDSGSESFQALQNAIKSKTKVALRYFIFDMPYTSGFDLTQAALLDRKLLLKMILPKKPLLSYSDHIQGQGAKVFKSACKKNLEGIVCKEITSPYLQKRTHSWLKVKCQQRQEFVIGGYTAPAGSRQYFGALLLGYFDKHKNFIYCGRVGTGFNQKTLKQIYSLLIKNKTEMPAFKHPPRVKATWLKPKLVCEVEFTEWTADNSLRHPSFKGLRFDKPATKIKKEVAR